MQLSYLYPHAREKTTGKRAVELKKQKKQKRKCNYLERIATRCTIVVAPFCVRWHGISVYILQLPVFCWPTANELSRVINISARSDTGPCAVKAAAPSIASNVLRKSENITKSRNSNIYFQSWLSSYQQILKNSKNSYPVCNNFEQCAIDAMCNFTLFLR